MLNADLKIINCWKKLNYGGGWVFCLFNLYSRPGVYCGIVIFNFAVELWWARNELPVKFSSREVC